MENLVIHVRDPMGLRFWYFGFFIFYLYFIIFLFFCPLVVLFISPILFIWGDP
jgi:hypothetical protein